MNLPIEQHYVHFGSMKGLMIKKKGKIGIHSISYNRADTRLAGYCKVNETIINRPKSFSELGRRDNYSVCVDIEFEDPGGVRIYELPVFLCFTGNHRKLCEYRDIQA